MQPIEQKEPAPPPKNSKTAIKTGHEPCSLNFCTSKAADGLTIGTPVPEFVNNLQAPKKKKKPVPAYSAKPSNDPKLIFVNNQKAKRL